ncbi:MAG: recombinase family protein [Nitratireductor sp.]
MSGRKQLRVAIYTRKSTEEGLEQDFNSLDAQREACSAFITSQKELGWKELPETYDDGGLSGGSLERPALLRLLEEVKAGRVDVAVVYKIDRLTRSLMDFSRIVEIFDRHEVSFVSVTQQFNTSTSMGRLTLNMLLSFAQFEREVTAERIRDKIAASKQKGMWMGGLAPLGYDAMDRKLVINEEEAVTIRWLFATYLELGTVRKLKAAADAKGIVSKKRVSGKTGTYGGVPLSRGILYRILSNPIYKGCVRHGKKVYPGQHDAIIDEDTFEKVQAHLNDQASNRRSENNVTQPHLLTGILYDDTGDRLSPTHAATRAKRYRYYISHRLMQADRQEKDGWRIPADQIEAIIKKQVSQLLNSQIRLMDIYKLQNADTETIQQLAASGRELEERLKTANKEEQRQLLQSILSRVTLQPDAITMEIDTNGLAEALQIQTTDTQADATKPAIITLPIRLRRRGVETKLVLTADPQTTSSPDPGLIRLIAQAHYFLEQLTNGAARSITDLAAITGTNPTEISRMLPFAFLAPDITRTILEGRHPVELTARHLSRIEHLPIAWKDQRSALGIG